MFNVQGLKNRYWILDTGKDRVNHKGKSTKCEERGVTFFIVIARSESDVAISSFGIATPFGLAMTKHTL